MLVYYLLFLSHYSVDTFLPRLVFQSSGETVLLNYRLKVLFLMLIFFKVYLKYQYFWISYLIGY